MSVTVISGAPVAPALGLGNAGAEGPTAGLTDVKVREIGMLARRVHADHPDVPIATVVEIIDRAHAELAGSRVQSFRMILAERAVRHRLAAGGARA